MAKKGTSRPARWAAAVTKAQAAQAELESALEELRDLQSEYQEWRDNLPDNLQSSTLTEKLDAVCDLDLDVQLDVLDEAEGLDLPMGFGKD